MAQAILVPFKKGQKTESLRKQVERHCIEGQDVILEIGDDVPPQKVLKIAALGISGWKVETVIRHAEVTEYLRTAATGAVIGAGVATAAKVWTAVTAGNPVTLAAVLSAVGIGMLAGGVIGAAATPFAQLRIYKSNGKTRVKYVANPNFVVLPVRSRDDPRNRGRWPFPS